MPSFQEQFMETRGQPIVYQGKTLFLMDSFPLENSTRLLKCFTGSGTKGFVG